MIIKMFKQVHIRTIGRRNYFYIIEKSMFQAINLKIKTKKM